MVKTDQKTKGLEVAGEAKGVQKLHWCGFRMLKKFEKRPPGASPKSRQ